MDPAQLAQGQAPQQQPQMPPPQGTTTPDQAQVGGDINKIKEAVGAAIQQAVDQQGFVDFNKLVAIWPQIAQQMGINVPFQTVWQLINQNPQMFEDLVVKYGLAGIIKDGQRYSAEQLQGMASGATGKV